MYFVVTNSGTILGRIIRCKTGKMYTHVSIALDENLERMYSFSRLNPYNCFIGGFMHEKLNTGCFKRFKNTKAMICYIEITNYQYEKLEEQIKIFEENRRMYKFNVLGCPAVASIQTSSMSRPAIDPRKKRMTIWYQPR